MLEAPQLRCERRCCSSGTPPSAIHYPHAVPICCHRPNRWSREFQNEESCNIFLTLTLVSGPGRLLEELALGPEPPTPLCCSRKSRRDRSCVSRVFTTARTEEPTGGLRPVTKGKSKYFFPLPMPRGAGAVARPVSGGAESSQDLSSPEPWGGSRAAVLRVVASSRLPHQSSAPHRAFSMSPGGTRVVPSS